MTAKRQSQCQVNNLGLGCIPKTLESDELYNAVMMLEEDLDAAELDGGNSHMPPDSVIKRTTSCSGLSTYAAVMDAAMSPTSEVPRAFLNGKTTPCGCDGQRTGLASPPLSAGGCKFHKSVTSRISASSSPLISPIPRKLLAPSRFGFSANGKSVAGIGGLVGWPMERYSFESAEMTQAKKSSLDAACAELFDIIHSPAASPGPEEGDPLYPAFAWRR
ncbi:hypothetical protein BC829DRAFT_448130 [Chytridium lagenaria]|nr:hypothetical protein BC829DRAFT_448130 [Chytridium lagenaria]